MKLPSTFLSIVLLSTCLSHSIAARATVPSRGTVLANNSVTLSSHQYWEKKAKNLDRKVDIVKVRMNRTINDRRDSCRQLNNAILAALHVEEIAILGLNPDLQSQQPSRVREHFEKTRDWASNIHQDMSRIYAETC